MKKKATMKKPKSRKKAYIVWLSVRSQVESDKFREFVAVGFGYVRPVSRTHVESINKLWKDVGLKKYVWFRFSSSPDWHSKGLNMFPMACIAPEMPDGLREKIGLSKSAFSMLKRHLIVNKVREIDAKDIEKEIKKLMVLDAV